VVPDYAPGRDYVPGDGAAVAAVHSSGDSSPWAAVDWAAVAADRHQPRLAAVEPDALQPP